VYCRYFGRLFETFKPTHIVFALIPHEGPEYVAYQIAKALGIPTMILMHTHVPELFYRLDSIEDYGKIPNPNLPPRERFPVPRKHFQAVASSQWVNRHLGWGFRKQRLKQMFKQLAKFLLLRPGALQRLMNEVHQERFLNSLPV